MGDKNTWTADKINAAYDSLRKRAEEYRRNQENSLPKERFDLLNEAGRLYQQWRKIREADEETAQLIKRRGSMLRSIIPNRLGLRPEFYDQESIFGSKKHDKEGFSKAQVTYKGCLNQCTELRKLAASGEVTLDDYDHAVSLVREISDLIDFGYVPDVRRQRAMKMLHTLKFKRMYDIGRRVRGELCERLTQRCESWFGQLPDAQLSLELLTFDEANDYLRNEIASRDVVDRDDFDFLINRQRDTPQWFIGLNSAEGERIQVHPICREMITFAKQGRSFQGYLNIYNYFLMDDELSGATNYGAWFLGKAAEFFRSDEFKERTGFPSVMFNIHSDILKEVVKKTQAHYVESKRVSNGNVLALWGINLNEPYTDTLDIGSEDISGPGHILRRRLSS